jgi:hypothetical protein
VAAVQPSAPDQSNSEPYRGALAGEVHAAPWKKVNSQNATPCKEVCPIPPKLNCVEGGIGKHCRNLASLVDAEIVKTPENGQFSESPLLQFAVTPASAVQLEMPVSNPGFAIKLPALGWGQVQAALVLQQRPPQELLVHSDAAAQS